MNHFILLLSFRIINLNQYHTLKILFHFYPDLFHQLEKLILKFQDNAWQLFQTWVRGMNLTSNLNMVQAQILTTLEYKRLRT
jgi:hypothetical protein